MIINLPQATNYNIVIIILLLVFDWIQCIDGATIKYRTILTDNYSPETNNNGGVPIDWNNYNVNSSSDAIIIPSAPGCPKPSQGLPWIYFGNPPKCYLVGTRGPCLSGHLFFGNGTLAPLWGHCDCPCSPLNGMTKGDRSGRFFYFDVRVTEFANYLLCKIKDVPELSHVTAVYDKQMEMCYFLDTQGPCQVDEWLVRVDNGIEQTENIACVPKCNSETELVGPFHSSYFYDSRAKVCKMNPSASTIQPVSLTAALGQQGCNSEDGMIYSKTLKKCIPKSKAFFIKFI